VRNELRIWSLNEKAFLKYLTDDCFRGYINERMTNPALQLHCRSFNFLRTFEKTDQMINSLLVSEMVAGSSIGYLSIYAYSLSDFPSSPFLHTLKIDFSTSLKGLGDFPVLDTLHLQNCSRLVTVGQMAKLKQLHLKDMNVLSEFPLEQLEMLVPSGLTVEDFPKISPRLKSLKNLHLALSSYRYGLLTFVAQQHPFLTSLVKLRLEYFNTVNLTGLINLKHLSILGTHSTRYLERIKFILI
jgi:hypothetical protein